MVHSDLYRRNYIGRASQQPRRLLHDDNYGLMNICEELDKTHGKYFIAIGWIYTKTMWRIYDMQLMVQ